MKNTRNNTVDIIRGFAMLLVVLGHTMSGSTSEFQDSLLFQVIWTLQMPLFIIISGYVTRYSRPLTDGAGLLKFIKKRSLAYLLPWTVWTLVVRAAIFGQTQYFDIKFLLWQTDSGYWFLLTIWTIAMVFGVADLLSNKIAKDKKTLNIFLHLAFCGVGMVGLAAIGYILGLSFFSIKLTLYYLPIYLIGYLYGQVQDNLMAKTHSKTLVNVTISVCLGLWLAIINRFDFYGGEDTPVMIAFRFCTSILGCTAIIGIFTSLFNGGGYFAHAQLGRSTLTGNLSQSLPAAQPFPHGADACTHVVERNNVTDGQLPDNGSGDSTSNQSSATQPNNELHLVRETKPVSFLKWTGVHSLEIYLIHGFSLCLLKFSEPPMMHSWQSWSLIVIDFSIAVALSIMYIRIIESNKLLNKILFWK